jgi:urease accessory protein
MKRNELTQTTAGSPAEIFLANRAAGRIALVAGLADGETRRRHVAEGGCLRVRFPAPEAESLEAVILNTGGGITGGDRHELDITVEDGARLAVTTAAAEKIYRSLSPDAVIDVKLNVGAGARLAWLPQEMILFDRGKLSRRIDVELAPDATLIMAEMAVFGRSAMGEAVAQGSFTDRWRVRRGGRLLFAETLHLGGAVAEKLAEPGVAAGGVAVATVLAMPGDEAMTAAVRALKDSFLGEVGVSAWNGIAVARLVAKDSASLRSDLVAVLTALNAPLPRLWLN